MIWGDWAYGSEDDPYDKYGQYGDLRLEEKLQGDDDVIILPRRTINEATGGRHDFWAGDGDDTVTIATRWATGRGWGGRGDDTFYLPDVFVDGKYYGGLGDDQMIAIPQDEATGNTATGVLNLYGGSGNDKIEGAHKAGSSLI